jgi:hypothetical protein
MPQGGIQQDLYVNGTNLLSTTSVLLSYGNPATQVVIPPSQIAVPSASVMRVRFTADPTTDSTHVLIAPPQVYTVEIQQENAAPQRCATPACTFTVEAVRPGLVGASASSVLQSGTASSLQIDGGFFGPPPDVLPLGISELVNVTLGGNNAGTIQSGGDSSARRLNLNLSQSALSTPGLFSLAVQNATGTPPAEAATNVAVQPNPAVNAPSAVGTVTLPSAPSAITLDSAIGVGVVALSGRDSVELLNLDVTPPALPSLINEISVNGNIAPLCSPCNPTSVAVDDQLHLQTPPQDDVAAVVNNAGDSISIVDLEAQSLLGKIDLSPISAQWPGAPPILPVGVGIDTNLHEGLVTFASSAANVSGFIGAIINVAPSLPSGVTCLPVTSPAPAGPYCITGVVTLNAGAHPQAAFDAGLRWMAVSPGGSGVFSIVDLARQGTVNTIAASNGLTRNGSGLITVTTTNTLNLDPMSPGSVLIEGTGDPSFDGSYAVVPSNSTSPTITSTSFTIQLQCTANGTSQSTPPACPSASTSGGGNVYYAQPLSTITLGNPTLQGIAVNAETHTAVLADPNGGSVYFVNLLKEIALLAQTNSGGSAVLGNVASAFQPYSNVGVVVNKNLNLMMLFDPEAPSLLGGGNAITTGTNAIVTGTTPVAVAIDPPTNCALVANNADGTLSVISLGSIKPVHISEVVVPASSPALPPGYAYTSSSADLTGVIIVGSGFSGSPQVQLDGAVLSGAVPSADGRELTVTIPQAFRGAPRRYALQVVNNGVYSNAAEFTVVGAVNVPCSSGAAQLSAVATGELYNSSTGQDSDIAVVTDAACDTISVVDLQAQQVIPNSVVTVGTAPEGVAILSRLGLAAVTNRNIDLSTLASLGDGSVSIVDLNAHVVTSTVTTNIGSEPLAVDIDQDTGSALIGNFGSSSLSLIPDITASSPTVNLISITQEPLCLAIDSDHHVAVVAAPFGATSAVGAIAVVDLLSNAVSSTFPTNGEILTGVAFDPVTSEFYVSSTDLKAVYVVAPQTGASPGTPTPVGISPALLAFNYQTSTIATMDPQSNSIVILDSQNLVPQTIFGPVSGTTPQSLTANTGAQQFGLAILQRTNLAVLVDQPNDRLLLIPLPH